MAFPVPVSPEGQEPNGVVQALEPDSVPSSQGSSFNDSLASQASPQRPMSSDIPQFSANYYSTRPITPSTSSSNPSSQERAAERLKEIVIPRDDAPWQLRPGPHDAQPERPRTLHPDGLNGGSAHAPKRTADGSVKIAGLHMPISPVDAGHVGEHSRNHSTTSKDSQIGELSNQLKTRLSYAMIKVQNGWQTRSIDELESMTSQNASPVSPISDLRHPYDSPRTTLMNTQLDRTGFTQSSERTTATPETVHALLQRQSRTSRLDYAYTQTGDTTSPQPGQSSRTYESFWREHSASNASRLSQHQSSTEGPSLAPPADIQPRGIRRSNMSQAQPPALQTCDQNGFSSSGSAPSAMPATPSQRYAMKPRTPSQNAAMEQDAVETLLFMSSPGNSGYHPPAQPAVTTLRNQLSRKPGLAAISGSNRTSTEQDRPNRPFPDHSEPKRLTNGADVDKLLDEMPDDGSSSDEDDLKTTRQYRRTVG